MKLIILLDFQTPDPMASGYNDITQTNMWKPVSRLALQFIGWSLLADITTVEWDRWALSGVKGTAALLPLTRGTSRVPQLSLSHMIVAFIKRALIVRNCEDAFDIWHVTGEMHSCIMRQHFIDQIWSDARSVQLFKLVPTGFKPEGPQSVFFCKLNQNDRGSKSSNCKPLEAISPWQMLGNSVNAHKPTRASGKIFDWC